MAVTTLLFLHQEIGSNVLGSDRRKNPLTISPWEGRDVVGTNNSWEEEGLWKSDALCGVCSPRCISRLNLLLSLSARARGPLYTCCLLILMDEAIPPWSHDGHYQLIAFGSTSSSLNNHHYSLCLACKGLEEASVAAAFSLHTQLLFCASCLHHTVGGPLFLSIVSFFR